MPFNVSWHTLIDELEKLPDGATLITPLSHKRFRITDVQKHRVIIQFDTSGENRPLQRDQFETLYQRIQDSQERFQLDRLPPDADPYPAVLSLHPRFEIDEDAGVIVETDEPTSSQLLETTAEESNKERSEPEGLEVYSDALLLIDALERNDVTELPASETETLVDLYTLLSDVQRNAKIFEKMSQTYCSTDSITTVR
jgi:hypothetical protein